MKKLFIVAALALATMCTPALAGVTMSIPYFPTGTPNSETGLGNAAGSISAGANSALNPSGNSFIVPPPGAIGAGAVVGPRS